MRLGFFCFKQKTAYGISECDGSTDVCSSDLGISQIYMGIFMKMLKFGLNKPITQKYGIQGNIQAVMALGYPLIQYRNYTDRE